MAEIEQASDELVASITNNHFWALHGRYDAFSGMYVFEGENDAILLTPLCNQMFVAPAAPAGRQWVQVEPRLGWVGRLLRKIGGEIDAI